MWDMKKKSKKSFFSVTLSGLLSEPMEFSHWFVKMENSYCILFMLILMEIWFDYVKNIEHIKNEKSHNLSKFASEREKKKKNLLGKWIDLCVCL
jgi:hypothetical protein